MTTAANVKDPSRESVLLALRLIMDPLLELIFDSGITVQEVTKLLRERSVHIASSNMLKKCGRASNSRIAIVTGLPRSEIARILSAKDCSTAPRAQSHSARRVLTAWYDSSRFLGRNRKPMVLPIFGKNRSFEQLVTIHGGGIPVRAMLDQLLQLGAVKIMSDQRVMVLSRTRAFNRIPVKSIEEFGEKASDLIHSLVRNLKNSGDPLFERTAAMFATDLEILPSIREEIVAQGTALIESTNALFKRSQLKSRRVEANSTRVRRIGVSLIYFEDERAGQDTHTINTNEQRKNLKRDASQSGYSRARRRTGNIRQ